MDSPLILLVFWFVVNLIIKSSKDKKKIEQARRNRSQQIGNQTLSNKPVVPRSKEVLQRDVNKGRSIIDVFKEEIDKEIQREKQKYEKPQEKKVYETKAVDNKAVANRVETKKVETNKVADRISDNIEQFDYDSKSINNTKSFDISENEIGRSLKLEKKDIIKGIILSEILSEPKSKRNMKRSM